MVIIAYFFKKGTQNASKRNSFVSNCVGEIKKLLLRLWTAFGITWSVLRESVRSKLSSGSKLASIERGWGRDNTKTKPAFQSGGLDMSK
jgi:hypothetical protein